MHATPDLDRGTTTRKQRSAPMEAHVADRLLDLLSSDDDFRRLFTRNPHAALEKIGFHPSAGALSPAGCFFGIEALASKSAIADARLEIRSALMSGLGQHPIQLDTGNRGLRRR